MQRTLESPKDRPRLRRGRGFACPRCHRLVDELVRADVASATAVLALELCASCIDDVAGEALLVVRGGMRE